MRVYSITIEAIESTRLGYFQNFVIASHNALDAINWLFSSDRHQQLLQIDIDEVQRLDDNLESDVDSIHLIEESGRSYFDIPAN